jgi:uncharacterized damage-inducible protein DinB
MPLRNASLEALQQVLDMVDIAGADYSRQTFADLQPIGTHVRHIIDHYWAFQQGLVSGSIDYNRRHRDTSLETDRQQATEALQMIYQWLQKQDLANRPIIVVCEISVSQKESASIESCVDRELVYLLNHTLHHIAYANLLAKSLGLKTPRHLGVAPATASFLRQRGEA